MTPAQIRALSAKGYTTDQIAEIAECIDFEEREKPRRTGKPIGSPIGPIGNEKPSKNNKCVMCVMITRSRDR